MRNFLIVFLFVTIAYSHLSAQNNGDDAFGKTFNAGVGIGYYSSVRSSLAVIHMNYEFDVAKNFTLAPFITFYSYRDYRYWGNKNNPFRDYYYRETVIPMGAKGTYYFDELFHAGSAWDFYGAASLGFAYRRVVWEDGYGGERSISSGSPLYLDVHIGTEYHLTEKLGLFLDLSTGVSTFGISIH